jgi:hypothetical protein
VADTLKDCAATTCTAQVPRHILMCRADWARVPKPLQAEVYRTWRGRRRGGWQPYLAARDAAIAAADESRARAVVTDFAKHIDGVAADKVVERPC